MCRICRHGRGRKVERVGHERVASAKTESADTAVAIDCDIIVSDMFPSAGGLYTREQQGVSSGQWLSFEHLAPAAKVVPAKAATATAAERRRRTMSRDRVCSVGNVV
jgi:hypothetical protein